MSKPPNEAVWRALWTGEPPLPTHRKRRIYIHIPSEPRCRICLAPFRGPGGWLMRLLGSRPSAKNPNYCSICEETARTYPGGAEVELALLFADLRGSTSLAEQMSPLEFKHKIDAFYAAATETLIDADAFIDKLVGDQVVGLFMRGMAGEDYPQKAIRAARNLVRLVAQKAGLPVGAGVHVGTAYVGTVEGTSGVERDIAAVGDVVNTTARLASAAGPGEVLISDEAVAAASFDVSGLEARQLALKGKSQPFSVHVLPVARA
ncbi:MAG TPA: adenylate/guanylate cyclase domain-containing protein [Anaerolineales bacterium]|nr:adenylate/guanylate cyclase domain-containing protein [Anaerolineales bacterium]